MEFKDRVANKPNRVKLNYEESGVSVYATVELADEPIEEGTPLNASNMNKLLSKEDNDYIVEQGKSGMWSYCKWNSGKAECEGTFKYSEKLKPEWYVTAVSCGFSFPFVFTRVPNVIGTLSNISLWNHWLVSVEVSPEEVVQFSFTGLTGVERNVGGTINLRLSGEWKQGD